MYKVTIEKFENIEVTSKETIRTEIYIDGKDYDQLTREERYLWKRVDEHQYSRVRITQEYIPTTKTERQEILVQVVDTLSLQAVITAINQSN